MNSCEEIFALRAFDGDDIDFHFDVGSVCVGGGTSSDFRRMPSFRTGFIPFFSQTCTAKFLLLHSFLLHLASFHPVVLL